MLYIDIFDDFISVGASGRIYKYAKDILDKDSIYGYDIDEMIQIVSKNSNILENFSFDSECGMFCMYYKDKEVTDQAITKCTELVTTLNNLVFVAHFCSYYKFDSNEVANCIEFLKTTKPAIHDYRN